MNLVNLAFWISLFMSSCQAQNSSINLVVLVNDKLDVDAVINTRLKIIDQYGSNEILPVTYYPGDLIIPVSISNKLKGEDTKSFFLLMDYYDSCGEEDEVFNYEIQMYSAWLEQPFLVFRFYNMNRDRNRKRFDPLEGEDYTYEIDLASNSIMRIRKVPDEDDCN